MVTQRVKLTEEQNRTLERLAASQGRVAGDLIREGVDVVLSEGDLVRRLAADDESAEKELAERYGKRVLTMLRRLAPEQADDLVHETLRIALERLRLGALGEPYRLEAFLARIALQVALEELRRQRSQRTDAEEKELAQAAHPDETVKGHLMRSGERLKSRMRLSKRESELLLAINRGPSGEVAERYHELIRRRKAEALSPEEHRELLRLTGEVERLQAERIESLSELARLRGISLGSLMEELEIRPATNA